MEVGAGRGSDAPLRARPGVRLPRLALRLCFTDARDHAKPRLQGGLAPKADGVIRLAEVLAAFGVPDDRALDAELEEHLGRDLAGEGPVGRPVDVLRVHRNAAPDRRRE